MAAELGTDFSLDAALRNGLIPLIVSAKSPGKTLATYIALYLKEEVKEEGLVRNIGAFARFLEFLVGRLTIFSFNLIRTTGRRYDS